MIRVLNIQETIGYGGVERTRLSLSKLLDKGKFTLKIICTKAVGSIADDIRSNNVELIEIGRFNSLFDFHQHRKVMKIIDEFKPHIIHGAVFEGVTMAAINGFIKRVPIIILEETSDPKNRSWRGNLLMKFFAKFSDVVIGVSPGVIEYLENTLKLPKHKIFLLNNGVVLPREVSTIEITEHKASMGIGPNEIVIGSVGRMLHDEHKKFSDLIKAFAIVCKTHNNVNLLLVGSGPEIEKYKKLSEELAVSNKVIFVGYQSDVALYYRLMNIFALVSAYEAFGLVLAEAMLHKLPIVATRVGGMQYIVDNDKTGFLVEKYDVKKIAEKLEILSLDSDLRKEFGENGYDKVMKEYTEERYVKEVENLYLYLFKKKNNLINNKKE